MSIDAHKTLWVKLNTIQLRLMELSTEALLENELDLSAWADTVCIAMQPFLKNTRKYHHGSKATPAS